MYVSILRSAAYIIQPAHDTVPPHYTWLSAAKVASSTQGIIASTRRYEIGEEPPKIKKSCAPTTRPDLLAGRNECRHDEESQKFSLYARTPQYVHVTRSTTHPRREAPPRNVQATQETPAPTIGKISTVLLAAVQANLLVVALLYYSVWKCKGRTGTDLYGYPYTLHFWTGYR